MSLFSTDHSFHYELLRNLAAARYQGAISLSSSVWMGKSKLGTLNPSMQHSTISPGEWMGKAKLSTRPDIPSPRETLTSAPQLITADFYLHGTPSDPRINAPWSAAQRPAPTESWLHCGMGEGRHTRGGLPCDMSCQVGPDRHKHGGISGNASSGIRAPPAVVAIDGVYDVGEAFANAMPPPMRAIFDLGGREKLDGAVNGALAVTNIPVVLRCGIEQGLWSFHVNLAAEWMERTKKMTLKGLESRIQCPLWVGQAEDD
ncbi:hypothetical protein BP6252_01843 [Coleophoma cylindrospora]|uniref:Uncharacterized protein n=1 Tax=Coleophoma cylindrospora TaxID=1849047 RepID=A0A3D8SD74_9HELO|nr:hypothetical protein BP6252_01843 [Coleophoma cylindrospora]